MDQLKNDPTLEGSGSPWNYWNKYSDENVTKLSCFIEGTVAIYIERHRIEEEIYVQAFGELRGTLRYNLREKYRLHPNCEC